MLDPSKEPFICAEPREFRLTTLEDIRMSKEDKRRGGGPRVGAFQEQIPGSGWPALPKYDFSTRRRSSAFNERMHVEWENHVDHILSNGGTLPGVSVVAKAGFRSCAPCCRDMLALARPTGAAFVMVDLADDDERGTFHFVTGRRYLPVPKEACSREEVQSLKRVVLEAQSGMIPTGDALHEAVSALGVPVDETAQTMYLSDKALLPAGCATDLSGEALLEVLHAEHFARLLAEYGASILRDEGRAQDERLAVVRCRLLAARALEESWRPHAVGVDLAAYAAAATAPLLSEDPRDYEQLRRALRLQNNMITHTLRVEPPRPPSEAEVGSGADRKSRWPSRPKGWSAVGADAASVAGASTAVPDDVLSAGSSDMEDHECNA